MTLHLSTILAEAHEAGMLALNGATPTPMVVREANVITGAPLATGRSYFVEGGACGFAWVNVYRYAGEKIRKNSVIGKALLRAGVRRSEYEKCFQVWVSEGGQSMQRKEAYAAAYARVLEVYGFSAYAGSRMD